MTESETQGAPLTAQVAAILDNREVLLDIGEEDGVALGMRFAIIGYVDVVTPGGRKVTLEYPKTVVKIVRLQDGDFSIGRTFRTIPGRKGRDPMSSALGWTPDIPDRTETIQIGDQRTAFADKDMVVRAGDVARLTEDDEFTDN